MSSPLHSSNCVSECTSFLYIGSGAYLCVGTDDSVIKSPLPITCIHSMLLISTPLPLHSSTCMLSCDFSIIKSPLPITCIQSMSSILAPLPLELLPCYLSTDLTMGSRYGVGLDDSSRSPLPFTCIAHTHVFNFSLPFLDLSVRKFCQKSSVYPTLPWLLCVLCAFILLAAKLWHYALALVGRCHDSLCQIGLLDLCHSLLLSDSLCDFDGSLRATCALLRHDFLPSS